MWVLKVKGGSCRQYVVVSYVFIQPATMYLSIAGAQMGVAPSRSLKELLTGHLWVPQTGKIGPRPEFRGAGLESQGCFSIIVQNEVGRPASKSSEEHVPW